MIQYENSSELYHYGVKGMKWGVRKIPTAIGARNNARMISVAQKHRTIDKARNAYKQGYTSKEDFKIKKATAKAEHKSRISAHKQKMKNMNDEQLTKYSQKLRREADNSVSNANIKRGFRIANQVITGYGAAVGAVDTMVVASIAPTLAPVVAGSYAANLALNYYGNRFVGDLLNRK